jgi:hypothetical protein
MYILKFFFVFYSLFDLSIKKLDYFSIGCYAAENSCGIDVFVETLTSTQCSNSANGLSMTCYKCGSYYLIGSSSGMTIEICLVMCNTNGFVFAGLLLYEFENFRFLRRPRL